MCVSLLIYIAIQVMKLHFEMIGFGSYFYMKTILLKFVSEGTMVGYYLLHQ
jgi:hypothetical protein